MCRCLCLRVNEAAIDWLCGWLLLGRPPPVPASIPLILSTESNWKGCHRDAATTYCRALKEENPIPKLVATFLLFGCVGLPKSGRLLGGIQRTHTETTGQWKRWLNKRDTV